jgi:hypothetical protein
MGNIDYAYVVPNIACAVCSKEFYVKPSCLLKGWGKYCSKKCNYQGQKTGSAFPCATCGKPTYKSTAAQQRSVSGKYFCNKSCQTIWRNSVIYIRENHSNWRGGEKSYREFMRRTSADQSCQRCKTSDTRVLAVHHKDRNRRNNVASNLIWLCHNCHYLVHHYREEAPGFVTA